MLKVPSEQRCKAFRFIGIEGFATKDPVCDFEETFLLFQEKSIRRYYTVQRTCSTLYPSCLFSCFGALFWHHSTTILFTDDACWGLKWAKIFVKVRKLDRFPGVWATPRLPLNCAVHQSGTHPADRVYLEVQITENKHCVKRLPWLWIFPVKSCAFT